MVSFRRDFLILARLFMSRLHLYDYLIITTLKNGKEKK
jgi:hypothetical protein